MSRHLRKGRLLNALVAPDLGKTDRAKSGAFALNRCRLQRARAGPSRDERICAKHPQRRERPSLSSRSQCRQYGCPSGRRFRPTRPPSVTVAAHLAGADRCGPGRQRRAQMTRSTDVALPLDGVVATGVADLVPMALNADRRPEHRGRRDHERGACLRRRRRLARSRAKQPLRGVAGLPCQGLSSGQAPVAGDVRKYPGAAQS